MQTIAEQALEFYQNVEEFDLTKDNQFSIEMECFKHKKEEKNRAKQRQHYSVSCWHYCISSIISITVSVSALMFSAIKISFISMQTSVIT